MAGGRCYSRVWEQAEMPNAWCRGGPWEGFDYRICAHFFYTAYILLATSKL